MPAIEPATVATVLVVLVLHASGLVGYSSLSGCGWTHASANNVLGNCTNTSTTLHCSNGFSLYCFEE